MIAVSATPATTMVETNCGIADDFRLLLPASKYHLLYGKPDDYEAERATIALAKQLAGKSDAFIDVGANEGLFTFSVATALGLERSGVIHAFEPDPVLFERLTSNIRRNRLDAHANNAAVSDHNGTQAFYRNLSDDLSGSLTKFWVDSHNVIPIEIAVVTLADYLERHHIERACVKVDAEGAGAAVWSGVGKAAKRIRWLIHEMIRPEIEVGLPNRIITETGWSAYYIRDFELIPSFAGEFEYRAPFYNWLFCAAAPGELRAMLSGSAFRVLDRSESL